jgi:hypothetical protein
MSQIFDDDPDAERKMHHNLLTAFVSIFCNHKHTRRVNATSILLTLTVVYFLLDHSLLDDLAPLHLKEDTVVAASSKQ